MSKLKMTQECFIDPRPARILPKLPSYLTEDAVSAKIGKTELRFLDFGNLSNLKRFMTTFEDAKTTSKESMKTSYNGWNGTKTWADYIELLDNGDEKVMKQIKLETTKQVEEFGKKYKEVIQKYKFDVVGEFFDVGLVLSGVPECWLEPEAEKEEIIRVDILINGAFSSGVDEKVVVKESAKLLAMVKILEDHKVQVCVRVINNNVGYNRGSSKTLITSVMVKDYDEPVNYRKISAILTPAHHRRGVFKAMEVTEQKVSGGYGTPYAIKGLVRIDGKGNTMQELEKRLFKGGE